MPARGDRAPLVSVGVPAYHAERFVGAAVERRDRARCLAATSRWTAWRAPHLARNEARTGVDLAAGRTSWRREAPTGARP